MKKKAGCDIANILVPIFYGLMAIIIAALVCSSGQYPYGSDTMNHIYRGNLVYHSVLEGTIFPLFDSNWYNGIEFFRYCAPIPTYFMAFCQGIVGGDPVDGYLLFVSLIFFLGGLSWFFIGKRKGRILLGTFIGTIWFFMPHNLFVLFLEGNLARAFCMIFLPIFICNVYDYLMEKRWSNLLKLMLVFICMGMCDLQYAVMIFIATALFMVVYEIIYHEWRWGFHVISAMFLSVCAAGVWYVPSIVVDMGAGNNIETMQNYFQSIIKTLNPMERFSSLNAYYYFGLAAFVLSVFGILLGKKKTLPGFLTAVLLLISTIASMYPVLKLMPGSRFLFMCQYISIALCMLLYAFLLWDTLRKPITVFLCILLAVDMIPSLNLLYGTLSGISVEERFDEVNETTLIARAKEVSQQRIALLDGNELEAMGAYLLSDYKSGQAQTFGGNWTPAVTKSNIVQLNRALSNGFYPYLFDRCKELGNDTVLIKLSQIDIHEAPVEMLDEAAENAGYELVDANEFYRLYDMDIEGNWGTISKYSAIGIGSGAPVISLCMPNVQEVSSINLNDFTFEELSQYELIYLAGFTYDDKESAEKLIERLSEAGVRIILLADGIPEDRLSHARDFLGVTCNPIAFSNGYPLLDTKSGVLDCDFFPQGYEEWDTVYVNGLDETWGTVREDGLDLDFYGTVKNEHIIVVGLNLTYYYSLTRNEEVGELLKDITEFSMGELPEREIIPLTVEYNKNTISVYSDRDEVNTALAWHEGFTSEQKISGDNHLLFVNAGSTIIKIHYPYFYLGLGITIIGMAGSFFFLHHRWKSGKVK